MSDNLPVPAMPQITVIEDGKEVPQERIDPAPMQFIMQAVAAAHLAKLRKLEESKVPVGTRSSDFDVGPAPYSLAFDHPVISFSMVNNGPGVVRVKVNNPFMINEESPVLPGQPFTLNCVYPVIEEIYLYSDTNATGSIYAKVGERRD